jgi:broad specificity phosphatase PhoE
VTGPRRLLLVRHGLPDYRVRQPADDWPGPPLSSTGFDQARQAGEKLAQFGVCAVYTSPLSRTWQTAEVLADRLEVPLRVDGELREWHRTERLHEVGVRLTRWLVTWLRAGEPCAVVVSHASPLLAMIRSALYLPHVSWHKAGHPDVLELSSGDRLEVSMASVFEIVFEPAAVTVRRLLHPRPRILYEYDGFRQTAPPRPVPGDGENREIRRPNFLRVSGA